MSAVLYARLPDTLKQTLHTHARERGLTLTQALVQLLEGAFQTIANEESLGELERQLQGASSELADTRGQLKEAQLGLQGAREREQTGARISRFP